MDLPSVVPLFAGCRAARSSAGAVTLERDETSIGAVAMGSSKR
jgi:hypothetical protein